MKKLAQHNLDINDTAVRNEVHLLMKASVFFIVIAGVALAVLYGIAISIYNTSRDQLRRYEQVYIGMPVSEMLSIMGNKYNVSSLKNNRQKYEWRIDASSYSYKGFRTYSGVSKVDIYVKDGFVEEIRPYNVK